MSVKIVCHAHPFMPSDRILAEKEYGKTIEEILADMVPHNVGRKVVSINGEACNDFSIKTKDGDHVIIKVIPAGGGNAQESSGKTAAWGAVVGVIGVITTFLVPPLGIALIGAGAAMFIVGGSTNLYLQATNAAKGAAGAFDIGKVESIPSIRGGRNQTTPWGKVPVIVGKHLITPFYAGRPYTEISGTDGKTQYLHQLFCVGYGPLKLSSIKIGETIIATNVAATRNGSITVDGSYADVEIQVYEDGTNPTLYPELVLEDSPNLELKHSDSPDTLWRATAPNVTSVSIDITFPRGLYQYTDSGTSETNTTVIKVKRRVYGSGTAWASATDVTTFSPSKNDPQTLRYTYADTVTAGQYEYAVYRFSDDETLDRHISQVYWSAFRSIRTGVEAVETSVRSKFVFLAIKIKATGQLQGVIDQLNCLAEAESATYDGSGTGSVNWPLGFSHNPAVAFLRALQGPMNSRPIADAQIDWVKLEAWYTTCNTKGWTCDAVITSGSRIRDTLNKIAQTGRAVFTLRDGLYSVVVDEAKTSLVQQFSPRNSRNLTWSKSFAEKPHGLKINFISASDGYAPNERIVLDDYYKFDINGDGTLVDWNGVDRTSDTDYTLASKFEQMDVWGVVDSATILKYGRYKLATTTLRPEIYSFETDAEGLICEPGDLIRLSHDAIVVGLASGRIKTVYVDGGGDATSILIDELCTIETAKSYAVRIRKSDGVSIYAAINNAVGETNELTFTTPIAAASIPVNGDLFAFGEATIETMPCIVAGLETLDDLSVRIYAFDQASGVHTADSGTIPAYVSRVSRPPVLEVPGNPAIRAIQQIIINETMAPVYHQSVSSPTPTGVQETIVIYTPRYLGRYLYASKPASANEGDTCTLYSTTAGERGIYLWVTSAWVKQTTPTTEMIANAWADVCWIVNQVTDYGETTAYTGSGVDFIDVLGANIAFINKLFAQYVKIQTGGSLRGGDRYDESGATIDGSKPGFYISASGACKVAGLEFEGSLNGGVQWGMPSQIGIDTNLTYASGPALAALNGTDVAFIDSVDEDLRLYRFNGTSWTKIGNDLNITGVGSSSLAALNKTDVVFIDNTIQYLTKYRFDGTNWSQIGTALNVPSTAGFTALAALNGTDVAYIDSDNEDLRLYRFNGSIWAQVGNDLNISTINYPVLAALNSTDVAFFDTTQEDLRVYRFDGTDWAQIGNDLNISGVGIPSITALNGTDIALVDGAADTLKLYRFDGTDWAQISSAGSIGISGADASAITALNGTDIAFIDSANKDLRVYRFPFSISLPYSRILTL